MEPKKIFKSKEPQKTLYCLNNEINTLDDVVSWLVMYFGYTVKQSVQLSHKINDEGQAAIYKGTEKELLDLSIILNSNGLETNIE